LANKIHKIELEVEARRITSVSKQLSKAFGANYTIQRPKARSKDTESLLKALKSGMNFFALIAIFVGSYLIFNTFSMSVSERTSQLSILRLAGATRKQIILLILAEATIIAVVGSLSGIILGGFLANSMMVSFAGAARSYLGQSTIARSEIIKALTMGFFVSLASALYPAYRASSVHPAVGVRSSKAKEETIYKKNVWIIGAVVIVLGVIITYYPVANNQKFLFLEIGTFAILIGMTLILPKVIGPLSIAINFILKPLFGMHSFLAMRNFRRAKVRSALTAAALMVGIVMAVAIQISTISFQKTIDDWITGALDIDIFVRPSIAMGMQVGKVVPMPLSLKDKIAKVEGVDYIAPVRFINTKAGGTNITVLAASKEIKNIFKMKFIESNKEAAYKALYSNDRAAIISTQLRENKKVHVGDYIDIKTAKGAKKYKVVGVGIDFSSATGTAFITWDNLEKYFGDTGVDSFDIEVKKGFSIAKVRRDIKKRIGEKYGLQVFGSQAIQKEARKQVDVSFSLSNALVAISLIVAFLGLINTLVMNIIERVREIAILRSVGTTKMQLYKIITVEAIFVGTCACLVGILGGVFASRVMVMALRLDSGYPVDYIFSAKPIIYVFIGSVIISVLAATYPAVEATKMKIRQALSYE